MDVTSVDPLRSPTWRPGGRSSASGQISASCIGVSPAPEDSSADGPPNSFDRAARSASLAEYNPLAVS